MIGYIQKSEQDRQDMGYAVQRNYWHKGITSEAALCFIHYLKCCGIDYITATHDHKNRYSGKVMQKAGMQYQYSYEELWQPKNYPVIFRMYQLNFKENIPVYDTYWNR